MFIPPVSPQLPVYQPKAPDMVPDVTAVGRTSPVQAETLGRSVQQDAQRASERRPLRPRKPNDWDAVDVSERGELLLLLDDVAEELLAVRSRLASDEAVYTVLRAADQLRQAYQRLAAPYGRHDNPADLLGVAASLQEGLTHVPAQDDGLPMSSLGVRLGAEGELHVDAARLAWACQQRPDMARRLDAVVANLHAQVLGAQRRLNHPATGPGRGLDAQLLSAHYAAQSAQVMASASQPPRRMPPTIHDVVEKP